MVTESEGVDAFSTDATAGVLNIFLHVDSFVLDGPVFLAISGERQRRRLRPQSGQERRPATFKR